jgi:hypothetical protein
VFHDTRHTPTNAKLDAPMWDFVTGKRGTGVRMVDAYQRVRAVCVDAKRVVMIRRIHPWTDALYDAIKRIRITHAGGKYQANPMVMADTLKLTDEGDLPEQTAGLSRSREAREQRRRKRQRVFCSQLVARILIEGSSRRIVAFFDGNSKKPGSFRRIAARRRIRPPISLRAATRSANSRSGDSPCCLQRFAFDATPAFADERKRRWFSGIDRRRRDASDKS